METWKTKTRLEDAICLCSREYNLQRDRLTTGFRAFNLKLPEPSPRLSGSDYQSRSAGQPMCKFIGGAYRRTKFG